MKTTGTTIFTRKPDQADVNPQDKFEIKKIITLDDKDFKNILLNPLDDYDFIKENNELMELDENNIWQVIGVTSDVSEWLLLINSEGYDYPRYASIIHKGQLKE